MFPITKASISYQLVILFLRQVVEFLKIVWGCFHKPYETYRTLSLYSYSHQVFFIILLIFFYALMASLAKIGIHQGVMNIFFSSGKAVFVAMFTYFIFLTLLFATGKIFKGRGSVLTLITLWSFSLLPTFCWFLASTFLFVLLPPPRTMSLFGQFFSLIFIAFSISCFIWKGILYYLTLRFGLKLDVLKIGYITILIAPILIIYAITLYKLGISKVPFI